MTDLQEKIINILIDCLGANKLSQVIVYLDIVPKHTGEKINIGDILIEVSNYCYLVFVDFEPQLNWGHACSYFAINPEDNKVIEYHANMPPFLKGNGSKYCLLWRGSFAPEWAVVKDQC